MSRRSQAEKGAVRFPVEQSLIAELSATKLLPEYSAPRDSLFTFQYAVTITNNTDRAVEVRRRCWEIDDIDGVVRVDALTVGGRISPLIEPNESFSYLTAVPFRQPRGRVGGYFHAEKVGGGHLIANISKVDFRASEASLIGCESNRASPEALATSISSADMRCIREALRQFCSAGKNAEFSSSNLKIDLASRLCFERVLLTNFFQNYRKQVENENPRSLIELSRVHRDLPDIKISDIFMLANGQSFHIIVRRADNIYRILHRTGKNYFNNETIESGRKIRSDLQKSKRRPDSRDEGSLSSDEHNLVSANLIAAKALLEKASRAERVTIAGDALPQYRDVIEALVSLDGQECLDKAIRDAEPCHPGKLIDALLEQKGMSVAALAQQLGFGRNQVYMVIRGGSGVSAELADRLEKIRFGPTAEGWLILQAQFELSKVREVGLPRRRRRPATAKLEGL